MTASQPALSRSRQCYGKTPVNVAGYVFVCARSRACACACQGTGSRYLDWRRNHNGNSIPTYCRHLLTLLRFSRSLLSASDETGLCLGTSHFFTLLCFSLIVAIYLNIYSITLIINHWTPGIDFFCVDHSTSLYFWYSHFVIGILGEAVVHPLFRQTVLKWLNFLIDMRLSQRCCCVFLLRHSHENTLSFWPGNHDCVHS